MLSEPFLAKLGRGCYAWSISNLRSDLEEARPKMEVVGVHDRREGRHARLRKRPTRSQIPSGSSSVPAAANGPVSITAFGSGLATGSRERRKALGQSAAPGALEV
jgi:hypothetical protein